MKKWIKITLGGIILLFIIDLMCIFLIHRPLLAIKEDNGDSVNLIYRGILYDTIICHESSETQIILKGFSYSCSYNGGNYVLIDKTKEIHNFACASMLEEFYQDENYVYYWDCIKGSNMIVRYENGFEETISKALEQNHIDIQILDKFNISYIKKVQNK